MVREKARSGDPDFDDKVPMADQVPATVTAPDGRQAYVTDSNGTVDAFGQHVNLDQAPDEGDNRPAPGEMATEASTVQVATPLEDTPGGAPEAKEYVAPEPVTAGGSDDVATAETPTTPAKAAKATGTSKK